MNIAGSIHSLPSFQKTRLAPTPSGFLHLGNLYSFVLTAVLAKKTKAKILLRIDDLDQERIQTAYVQDVFDTLRFMGISWQEGPGNVPDYENHYSQLLRMDLYRQALEQLKDSGLVYACACSRSMVASAAANGAYPGTCRGLRLPLDSQGACWRLHTPNVTGFTVKNIDGTLTQATFPAGMRDFVVRKKDGSPAYQLSSLIDDVHFGIDLVVRGEDLWPSTLAQLHLASLLKLGGFTQAAFYHHPLLMAGPGKKLSKSAGDTSVHYLRKRGSSPQAVYAMLGKALNLDFVPRSWEDFEGLP